MCNFLFAGRYGNPIYFKVELKTTQISFVKFDKTLCLYVDGSFHHMGNFSHSKENKITTWLELH